VAVGAPGSSRWRIAVIDDHVPSRTLVTSTLVAAGGAVVAEADTAAAGLAMVEGLRPDAVVLAVGLPDRDGVDVAALIMERAPCAIVLLTSRAHSPVVERARLAGAMAYLMKPVRPEEPAPAIELAIARFGEWHRASHEAAALRRALADRKLIERAKGLLMQRLGLAEQEAFRMLQKTAMDRRVSMADLATALVKGETIIAAPRKRGSREP
jgi:two-component system, response regulator PdtaR